MQLLWLCIFLCKCFEWTFKTQAGKGQMNMPILWQAIWGHIWKRPEDRSQIVATSVTLHPHIWGDICKHTVEKVKQSQTNAIDVIMQLLVKMFWGRIWTHTVEKSQTNASSLAGHLKNARWREVNKNAINVTLPLLGQAIWEHIWKHTVEKSQTNVISATMPLLRQAIWGQV